jgi:hypothetical protein
VTFRHRRELAEPERRELLRALLRPDGRRWEVLIAVVLPERSELIFQVLNEPRENRPYELSEIVERAKNRAGKLIIKRSGERFSPFYLESFDRIIRDESELEERWQAIFDAPTAADLAESPDEYEFLWVQHAP